MSLRQEERPLRPIVASRSILSWLFSATEYAEIVTILWTTDNLVVDEAMIVMINWKHSTASAILTPDSMRTCSLVPPINEVMRPSFLSPSLPQVPMLHGDMPLFLCGIMRSETSPSCLHLARRGPGLLFRNMVF
jgi:hypothetical protein